MLPDIGATELLVIAVVALIVVGPKDLPMLLRRLGQFMAKLRGMAAEGRTILFSSHILEEVERLAERVLVIAAAKFRQRQPVRWQRRQSAQYLAGLFEFAGRLSATVDDRDDDTDLFAAAERHPNAAANILRPGIRRAVIEQARQRNIQGDSQNLHSCFSDQMLA